MNTTIIKECPKHGMTEHTLEKNGSYRCKECRKDAVLDIRRRNKIRLVEYKGGKCERCGYDKCIDALEFHHLNPEEKDFALSCGDTRSIEKLKAEVDKCIMVCANCHREIHAEEREKLRTEKESEEIKNEIAFFNRQKGGTPEKQRQSRKLLSQKLKLDVILEDIRNGVPKKEISKKLGVSVKAIKTFLRKNGIVYDETINKNITTKIEVDDFIKQFKKHLTFTGLAKHYGVSDNAIRKWCEKNNLPWRKKELVKFVKNYNMDE